METTEQQAQALGDEERQIPTLPGDEPQPIEGDRADPPIYPDGDPPDTLPHAAAMMVAEPDSAPLLESSFALPRATLESVLWVVVILSALLVRVASLTNNAFGTAEAQRAYAAWQFVDGQGARVDGALWGPLPFLINTVFFFLFGARDAIARLGPALAGIAIVPICWWLRPYVGRWGALGVAAMLALSPTFVYGSRHLSGIPYVLLAALALFLCVLRLADARATTGTLAVAGIAIAFLIGSGPSGLTMLVAFAFALAILALLDRPNPQTGERQGALYIIGAQLRQVDRRIWWSVVALVALLLLAACSLFFTDFVHLPRTLGSLFGRWWDDLFATTRNQPWYYYLLIAFVYEPFIGVAAIIGIVLIARTAAPRPLAMTLPLTWQLVALVLFSLSGGKTPENAAMILLALTLIGGTAIEWAAERLRGGWFWRERGWMLGVAASVLALAVAQFIRQLLDVNRSAAWIATILVVIALLLAAGYATMTMITAQGKFRASTALLATLLALSCVMAIRSMSDATFSHPADGRELLANGTAASVTPFVERVKRISIDLTRNDRTLDPATGDRNNIAGGNTLAIAAENSVAWPFQWYFRDFPNFTVGSAQEIANQPPTNQSGTPMPRLVIVPSAMETQVTPTLPGYVSQQYPATIAFPDAYRAGSAAARLAAPFKPATWGDWLRYFAARETPDPPTIGYLTAYLNKEAADKVFFAAPSPSSTQAAPSNLFDHAGKGKAGGQFSAPRGIAVGPDGTITIVDQLNYRVQQFQPDGTFLRQWGGIGAGPGMFGQINGYAFGPTGLAVAPDGTIFVADTWNHRISAFTSDGKPVRQWGSFFNGQENPAALPQHTSDFYGPRGIAIGPDGLVYVTDTGNSRVLVFDQSGKFVRTFGSFGTGDGQMDNPVGIADRADGTIAVADTNNARILLFSAAGQYQSAIPVADWSAVRGLEAYPIFLKNGNLLIPSPTGNQLIEMTTQGQTVRTITGNPGDLRKPVAVAVTADGTTAIVVNDETNSVVKVSLP
ncbi:MAG: 6-bladed beta-propeller [Chloroflexota bacterium]|nr:6-bladed beta-propeller [Chloroflexota bacterium]